MYWEVGIKIDYERGRYNVHPQALQESQWDHAVQHVLEMAQALYPKSRIEFEYVKEYETHGEGAS